MPSFFVMSIAIPRFTTGLRMRAGLPSTSPNASFIPGCFSSARTIAHATKCVKEIFERPSASRCRFRIRRFSSMFLTGTTRFVVAVGTPSDASMFRAIVAAPPVIGTAVLAGARGRRGRARGRGRSGAPEALPPGPRKDAAAIGASARPRERLGRDDVRRDAHRERHAVLQRPERPPPALLDERRVQPVMRVELERVGGVVAELLEHGVEDEGRGRVAHEGVNCTGRDGSGRHVAPREDEERGGRRGQRPSPPAPTSRTRASSPRTGGGIPA